MARARPGLDLENSGPFGARDREECEATFHVTRERRIDEEGTVSGPFNLDHSNCRLDDDRPQRDALDYRGPQRDPAVTRANVRVHPLRREDVVSKKSLGRQLEIGRERRSVDVVGIPTAGNCLAGSAGHE
jgi:hypothetical protein